MGIDVRRASLTGGRAMPVRSYPTHHPYTHPSIAANLCITLYHSLLASLLRSLILRLRMCSQARRRRLSTTLRTESWHVPTCAYGMRRRTRCELGLNLTEIDLELLDFDLALAKIDFNVLAGATMTRRCGTTRRRR